MRGRIAIATVLLVLACSGSDDERTSSSSSTAATSSGGGGAGLTGAGGAGAGGSGDGIACPPDPMPCGEGQYCCFPVIAVPTSCETDEAACDENFSIMKFCDGPEDCAAGVCCYTQTGGRAAPEAGRVECASSCSEPNQHIVCDPDDSTSCDSGMTCTASAASMPLCQ